MKKNILIFLLIIIIINLGLISYYFYKKSLTDLCDNNCGSEELNYKLYTDLAIILNDKTNMPFIMCQFNDLNNLDSDFSIYLFRALINYSHQLTDEEALNELGIEPDNYIVSIYRISKTIIIDYFKDTIGYDISDAELNNIINNYESLEKTIGDYVYFTGGDGEPSFGGYAYDITEISNENYIVKFKDVLDNYHEIKVSNGKIIYNKIIDEG